MIMKYTQIGKNIRQHRESQNLTQQMLADRIGVSWEMISRYERGSSSPFTKIKNISDALGVPISTLIDNKIDNYNPRIPLHTSIPSEFIFCKEDTRIFYNCPEWIYQKDKDSFAITSDLVSTSLNLSHIYKEKIYKDLSIFFISPHSKTKANILLAREIDRLVIIEREEISHKHIIIGGVLAQEIAFK